MPAAERARWRQHPPSGFPAAWVCEEQICGVDGFQARHPSSAATPRGALSGHSAVSPVPRERPGGGPGVCPRGLPGPPLNFAPSLALLRAGFCFRRSHRDSRQPPGCTGLVPPCGLAGSAPRPSWGGSPCAPRSPSPARCPGPLGAGAGGLGASFAWAPGDRGGAGRARPRHSSQPQGPDG